MALIKLESGQYLRSGKHGGSCLQESGQGISVKNSAHGRQWRSPIQLNAKSFTLYCTKQWRELSSDVRELWNLWAHTFPQPTILDPLSFLNGYELFVKRNYYLYLFDPASFSWMTSPVFFEYDFETISVVVQVSESKIQLQCNFSQNLGSWDFMLFLSNSQSTGLSFGDTRWRYVGSLRSSSQTIDITDSYLAHFGVLPQVGDSLFLSSVSCGSDNGQFTFHALYKQIVQEINIPVLPIEYGMLYNWHSVNSGLLAPSGWHVPTFAEWYQLFSALGGIYVAGGKMKETGTTHWKAPNTGATNSSLFTALPEGYRDFTGLFAAKTTHARYWTSTQESASGAYFFNLYYNFALVGQGFTSKNTGFAVRCIKNDSVDQGTVLIGDELYPTIKIGNQVITAVDLRTGIDSDGTPIPLLTSNADWLNTTTSARCWYNNIPL